MYVFNSFSIRVPSICSIWKIEWHIVEKLALPGYRIWYCGEVLRQLLRRLNFESRSNTILRKDVAGVIWGRISKISKKREKVIGAPYISDISIDYSIYFVLSQLRVSLWQFFMIWNGASGKKMTNMRYERTLKEPREHWENIYRTPRDHTPLSKSKFS